MILVHGIFQARVLEWVVIFSSMGSSWPRDQTQVSRIAGRCFTIWATREAQGRGTRDQIANICWTIEKAREFQKNIYFYFIDYAKDFNCVDHNKTVENSERDGNTRPPDLPREICMQVRKQQLELDVEQQTGSK